jgi:hypothetical protein
LGVDVELDLAEFFIDRLQEINDERDYSVLIVLLQVLARYQKTHVIALMLGREGDTLIALRRTISNWSALTAK